VGNVAHTGKKKSEYRMLKVKPAGKRPFGTHRHRWEGNIKMDPKEIGRKGMIGFIWLRTGSEAGSCEHGDEFGYPIKCRKFFEC